MIGADQDLQEKGGVKKEEEATKSAAVVIRAKAPPVSATERIPRSYWF